MLALGDEALLSYRTSTALWGLSAESPRLIDVTVPGRSRRGFPGVAVHRTRRLDPEDRAVCGGVPVTSVARTLLDLSEAVDARRLRRAWEEADRLRLLDVRQVLNVCDRAPGRAGRTRLLVLAREHHSAQPTRSELESLFLDLCRRHGLDPPAVNTLVEGFEVDMLWRYRKLIIELDGYAFHRTRQAFERDRARDAKLQLAGYRVVRFTYRRITEHAEDVARTIRRLLDPVA